MNRRSAPFRSMVAFAAAAMALAACGSSSKSKGQTSATTAAGGSGGNSAVQKAAAATATAEKGTNRNVDPTPRPAAKGKHVVVISNGQASDTSSIPSNAVVAAAKALGWQVDLYDAKLNPANFAPLVRQAVAAGADGIVLDAIDCQTVQQPLQEAKAKNIAVIGIYAFDCTDPHAGGQAQGLYSTPINLGPKSKDFGAFVESYAVDQANYIVADSNNKAKIIAIQDPEFTILYYTLQGFKNAIDASGGAQIVETVNMTVSDLATGQLVPKLQAAFLRHPEATWVKSPFTAVTTIGIVPALGAKAGQVKVMGGEGFVAELDLMRQGKVTAANIFSAEWLGWASIDTMNSVFLKQTPVDSGIGWTIVDKDHGLPPSGPFNPPIDFKSEYKKAWGVG
jgi:ribose transport system substrate-binding protein